MGDHLRGDPLEHAAIACHNNDITRDLRRPVKGKANFHFAGSPRGADVAAVLYSLIGTCLLQDIDPHRYLLEVTGRLDEPPSALTPSAIRAEWLSAETHAVQRPVVNPTRRGSLDAYARTARSADHRG